MSKLKAGIIGAGQIAETVHIANYQKYPEEVEVTAIVDTIPEKARAIAEKYNIPYYFSSAKKMFEALDLDIASICTPNKFHYENVMLALKNNCNVFCEKPPGIKAKEALEMLNLSKEKNKVLAYNFHHRHSTDVEYMKKSMDSGQLGDIYYGRIKALRRRGIPGWGVFTNKELQGGGPLIDLGVHMLDAALYLAGFPKIKSVSAFSYTKIGNVKNKGTLGEWNPEKFQVEDFLTGYIKFENGSVWNLETSFALNIKEKTTIMNVELFGTEGGMNLADMEIYTEANGELTDIKKAALAAEDKQEKSVRDFINVCKGDKNALITNAEEGYEIQRLVEALYTSAETGKEIEL